MEAKSLMMENGGLLAQFRLPILISGEILRGLIHIQRQIQTVMVSQTFIRRQSFVFYHVKPLENGFLQL